VAEESKPPPDKLKALAEARYQAVLKVVGCEILGNKILIWICYVKFEEIFRKPAFFRIGTSCDCEILGNKRQLFFKNPDVTLDSEKIF
jgi:hypothetical protein